MGNVVMGVMYAGDLSLGDVYVSGTGADR